MKKKVLAPAKAGKLAEQTPTKKVGAAFKAGMRNEEPEEQEQEDTAIAVRRPDNHDAVPNFGNEDLSTPRLNLAQGLSKAVKNGEANVGDWTMTGFDPVQLVHIIPRDWTKGRKLQDKDDFQVLCSSSDMVNGVGEYGPGSKLNRSGQCKGCPMAAWGEKNRKTGKSTPPPCNEFHQYTVWSITHQSAALLELSKSATTVAQQVNTVCTQKRGWIFGMELGSEEKSDGNRSWVVPKFRTFAPEPQDMQDAIENCG
jgi:hypothetical protein